MMKNAYNTHIVIDQINSQLWKLFDILRGSSSIEDLQIIFLLISAYKDGLIEKQGIYSSNGLKNLLINDLCHSNKYDKILKVYEPIIRKIPSQKLDELLLYLTRIDQHELDVMRSNFSEIFDYLLQRLSDSLGKYSGEFIQPLEITRFIMDLAGLSDNAVVYNPFAGLASYSTFLSGNQTYFGQEVNKKTWALGMLRIMAHNNLNNSNYVIEDSIEEWPEDTVVDLVVTTPPFGLRINNNNFNGYNNRVEQFLIEQSLKTLNSRGKLICVLPIGFLFRGGREGQFREWLVQNNLIQTIVNLPSGLLKNTGISVCILVISKSPLREEKVRMVNATGFYIQNNPRDKILDDARLNKLIKSDVENEFQCFVSKEDLQNSEYNLNVPRYFAKEYTGVKLSSIVEYKRGERIQEGEKGKFIRIRDLKDDKLDHILDIEQIEVRELPKMVRRIEETSLLLSMRWKTLKPTYFKYENTPIYISNDIISVKVDESKIDSHYLINELHSERVLNQLDSYRITGVVQFIRREDLFNLKIEVPSIEEQRGKVKGLKELSKKIKILEKERNALAYGKAIAEFDEFRSLKHSLGAPRQNILSNAKSLIRFFETNNSDAFIEVRNQFKVHYETEISEVLMQIRDNIDHISVILEKGEGGLILNNYQNEIISLKEIDTILKNYSNNGYKFNKRYEPLKKDEIGKNALNCNLTLFKILIDNIFSNADKYGFIDKAQGNEVVIEIKPIEDFLEVIIKNNGLPFPKNFNKEKFITKFTTVDSNNGSGIGGYDINRIAKYFGDNDWELILGGAIYPVEFKFNFPLIKIENE